jgi:hypothetical protein
MFAAAHVGQADRKEYDRREYENDVDHGGGRCARSVENTPAMQFSCPTVFGQEAAQFRTFREFQAYARGKGRAVLHERPRVSVHDARHHHGVISAAGAFLIVHLQYRAAAED